MKTQTELEQEVAGHNEFDDIALNPHFENVRQTYGSNDKEAPPILLEDDVAFQKWCGPLILGPFIPAILAVLNILYGQVLVVSWTGDCGYALDFFIQLTIGISYVFVLVYFWIFLGADIYVTLPCVGTLKVASPFTTLRWLFGAYFMILTLSFFIFVYGTILTQTAQLDCEKDTPELYRYCNYLIYMYWIIFAVVLLYVFKLKFGAGLEKIVREKTRETTIADAADNIFKSKYKKYDPGFKERQIERKHVKNLLKDLGVFIPAEEVETLLETWDPEETGFVTFDSVSDWFKQMNEEIDDSDLDSDDSDQPVDKEVAALEKKRREEKAKAKANAAQTGKTKTK